MSMCTHMIKNPTSTNIIQHHPTSNKFSVRKNMKKPSYLGGFFIGSLGWTPASRRMRFTGSTMRESVGFGSKLIWLRQRDVWEVDMCASGCQWMKTTIKSILRCYLSDTRYVQNNLISCFLIVSSCSFMYFLQSLFIRSLLLGKS